MERYYSIGEVAMMSGFTTRTLRNYIKNQVLSGEKIEGVWKFSEDDISDFFSNPDVRAKIQAKNKSIVYDFLADNKKKTNQLCTIIDLSMEKDAAEEICKLFCDYINKKEAQNIRFSFDNSGKHTRLIISGNIDFVMDILNKYHHRQLPKKEIWEEA